MRYRAAALFAIMVPTLSCEASSTTALRGPPREVIESCITNAATRLKFNGSIFASLGDVRIERSFGTSDAAGEVSVNSKTRFSLGSASKMFTAMAIARLVDRSAIDLNAPIGRYLPDLKPEFSSITVAQLLNHTSGLGDYLDPRNKTIIDAALTATDLLPLALTTAPSFPPGSKRAYSNSGFVVLGAIIEKVSGMSYAKFVQKEILTRLGMTHTQFLAAGSAEPMTRMSPGGMLDAPIPSPLRDLHASPAGGVVSTTEDIAKFLTALSNGALIRRATLEEFLLPRADPSGAPGNYGYGFNVRIGPPLRVGHGGGAPGVNAEIAYYPDTRWQLVALSNNDPPTASRMVTVLEKTIFAPDPEHACAGALADPLLFAPLPTRP